MISLLTGCGSDEESPRERCVRVRDHVVELRVASNADPDDRAAHAAIMKQALGEKFVDSCQGLSEAQQDCVLAATTSEAATSCRR